MAEYCLLTALIALVGLVFIYHAAGGLQNMWTIAGNTLTTGNGATGAATAPDSGESPGN